MKVLHLLYDHTKNPWVGGGGATRCHELYSRLAAQGHEITVVSGRYPGAADYSAENASGSLNYRFVGTGAESYPGSTFAYAFGAARFVLSYASRYDVIVEDFAPWNPVMSRFLTRRPVVLQVHHKEGSGILRRHHLAGLPFMFAESIYPRLFRNVCTVSAEMSRQFGQPRAQVIENGIDSSLLSLERRDTSGEGFILYMGRLEIANKGLDVLMKAMRKSRLEPLVIAGRGRDEARLREMSKGLRVEFRGFVSDEEKRRLLGSCSALVLPSRFEGWGISALEAAACGAPAVVSDIPGLRWAVEAGFALPFRAESPEDLAAKLATLRDNPGIGQELGSIGRAFASGLTWEAQAKAYEQYLLDVAGGGR